jgi:uncharacterized protein (TIGR02172 family)
MMGSKMDGSQERKAPERIDLGGYIRSGEGFTAESYDSLDGRSMLKLYKDFVPEEVAWRELRVGLALEKSGIRTPRVRRIVTDGERLGVEFERIFPKVSFARAIADSPGKADEYAVRFAHAARKLHSTPCDKEVFPPVKDFFRGCIDTNGYFTDEEKSVMRTFLETMPDAWTCLHGDLHFGNLITDGKEDIWIDMADFRHGSPLFDLAMMYHIARNNSEDFNKAVFHAPQDTIVRFWETFLREYLASPSPLEGLSPAEAEEVLKRVSALYMVYFSTRNPLPKEHEAYIRTFLLNGSTR